MLHKPSLLSDIFWKLVWKAKQTAGIQAIDDPRPLFIDWSGNQGFVNCEILQQNDVLGVVGRAGRTWYSDSFYPDPLFAPVYNQAGELGLYRTSYHVIHTDKDIVNQTNLWYSVHPARDIVPRWIDLEVDRGDSPAKKAEATWKMVELVETRDGIAPTIYSRYLLVNQWLVPYWSVEQLNHVTWALAQYLFDRTTEHPGPPTLPIGVREDRVVYQQTADKIPGWDGAIGSSALDRLRWTQGNTEQMKSYIINNWGGTTDPDLPPFPIGDTMPLQDVLLKSKVVFHAAVSLTGMNQNAEITIPDLPANVRGLKIWMIVQSDKPGAFVFFSPGQFGEERFHIGARSQVVNLPIDEIGDLLLDGNKIYRQHDAKGGTVTYWLFITGYKVEVPQADLTEINRKIEGINNTITTLATKTELNNGLAGLLAKVKNALQQAINSL